MNLINMLEKHVMLNFRLTFFEPKPHCQVPRQEYFDQLQELMEPFCSPTFFAKLFHADFKQHNEALKILISKFCSEFEMFPCVEFIG